MKNKGKLEKWIYESRPVSLLLLSIPAIVFPTNQAVYIAGIVLLGSALSIIKMRLRHRGYISF